MFCITEKEKEIGIIYCVYSSTRSSALINSWQIFFSEFIDDEDFLQQILLISLCLYDIRFIIKFILKYNASNSLTINKR